MTINANRIELTPKGPRAFQTKTRISAFVFVTCSLVFILTGQRNALSQDDPLASWNDGSAKQTILNFVAATTTKGNPSFLEPEQRIAIFDDDGTIWPENPVPFPFAFVIDELKRLNSDESGWDTDDLIQAAISGERRSFTDPERVALTAMVAAKHAGATTEDYAQQIRAWGLQAKHSRFKRLYTDLAYQPMREVVSFLNVNGYKTYVLSDKNADFVRVFSQELWGIPQEHVFGPFSPVTVELRDEAPLLVKALGNENADQPIPKLVEIHQRIGRLPVICFANSDSDLQVLQATTMRRSPALGVIVHHTDQEREYVYDAQPSSTGKLIQALELSTSNHWTVVDMKTDWKNMFSERRSPDQDDLGIPIGVDFAVEDIGGTGVIESSGATIRFEPENQVSGSTGCNRFTGTTAIDAQKLIFGPIAMTRRACASAIMEQENRMSLALRQVALYKFDDENDSLLFLDKDSEQLMRLSRVVDSRE